MKTPEFTDLLLIGSGPHALTLAAFLTEADPSWSERLAVLDPSGTWLTKWDRQMASQEIAHLRSSSVHHPDPNPLALRQFAQGRFDEFYPPYHLPGVDLFRQFCAHILRKRGLEHRVAAERVKGLIPNEAGFGVRLEGGASLSAKAVVFALGGGPTVIPDFARPWLESGRRNSTLLHSDEIDLRELSQGDEHIVIVGAGLTAGHLALGALKRGHRVTLLARGRVRFKLFDAAPGWIGPKYMTRFHAEPDWVRRRKMILRARGHGAMTEEIRILLQPFRKSRRLTWKTHCSVSELRRNGVGWSVVCGHKVLQADRVWLCTGTRLDLKRIDFLEQVWKTHPVELVDGLPVLDYACKWPNLPLYVLGIPAGLRVGPVARNLPGARQAASRIVEDLTGKRVSPN